MKIVTQKIGACFLILNCLNWLCMKKFVPIFFVLALITSLALISLNFQPIVKSLKFGWAKPNTNLVKETPPTELPIEVPSNLYPIISNQSALEISVPAYWTGRDIEFNKLGNIDFLQNEWPSLNDYLNSTSHIIYRAIDDRIYFEPELKNATLATSISAEKWAQMLRSKCKLIEKDYSEPFIYCNVFDSSNFVKTECALNVEGKITSIYCVFPDYLSAIYDLNLVTDSRCISQSNECNKNLFLNFAYNEKL
jgi:hypothetical protein